MRSKPLAGVRVLDLTRLLPGPLATMHLADLGADVVKLEDTGAGDYARELGATRGGDSAYFTLINRNKRGLRLDLKNPAGRDVFLKLAEDADVLVEQFRPGVMQRLGVGYDTLAAANPRLVYCSISGYGQSGPYRDRAGHDINYVGYAGVGDQIGVENGPPVIPNFQIADLLGGSLAPVMGILAALLDARSSGKGRYVDCAMTDAVLAHAVLPLSGLIEEGKPPERGAATLSGALPGYNVYRTRDQRYLAVGALEKKFWENLCDALDCPELKPDHLVRGKRARGVKLRLAEIFAAQDQSYWVERLADKDCCVSPILTIEEALRDEQFRARGMVLKDSRGEPIGIALPLQMSEFTFSVDRGPPGRGEHTDEILREAGYSAADINSLRQSGAI